MPRLGSTRYPSPATSIVDRAKPDNPVLTAPSACYTNSSGSFEISAAEQALFNSIFGPLIEHILAELD